MKDAFNYYSKRVLECDRKLYKDFILNKVSDKILFHLKFYEAINQKGKK